MNELLLSTTPSPPIIKRCGPRLSRKQRGTWMTGIQKQTCHLREIASASILDSAVPRPPQPPASPRLAMSETKQMKWKVGTIKIWLYEILQTQLASKESAL